MRYRKEEIPLIDTTDLLTVTEVAKRLKVTAQSVRTLIKNKYLKAERVGSQWLTSEEDLKQYIEKYDVVIEPDDHERLDDSVPPIVALSFFSGAMGLDVGMRNGGIDALLACEFNKACRMTIEKNNPNIGLIGDITKFSAAEILEMAKVPEGRKVDIIFGGPPCQAFSTAGNRKAFDDERGNVLGWIEDRTNKTRRPVSKDELNISFINIYPRFYLLVIYQDVANAFLFKISNKTNNVN